MIYPVPRVLAFGDAALLVEFADEISTAANDRVRALDAAIASANIPGIVEAIPAYRSLLVEYDPLELSFADLQSRVGDLIQRAGVAPPLESPVKRVPTVYGGEFGPDLADVAAMRNLTEQEVIAIHSGAIYRVYMLGFSPGFAYMGQIPESIATPRLATPRTRVPAGSVAIAGRQTGIYPQSTPGGWRILGRTNLTLFDARREPPCFFQPGDRVQFVPVRADEIEMSHRESGCNESPAADRAIIEVIAPGFLTTVQDAGRSGHQRFGVPVSGAMDAFALRAANALVGNAPDSAALEITVAGPTLRFAADALVAITGGDLQPALNSRDAPMWTSLYVRAGSLLEFGARRNGCRAYLAIAGGIVTTPVINSQSTYLAGGFGGCGGRALQAGDVLAIGETRAHLPSLAGRVLPEEQRPAYRDDPAVRVVLGPQDDFFARQVIETFFAQLFEVSATSDRMGLRLQGALLPHKGASEIVSNGVALGAIQVPPNAQPIILMADRQTAGGYPVIATVIRADIPLLAQCLPGQSRVRFRAVAIEEAQAIYRAEARKWQPQDSLPEVFAF
jgi:KipI family sensor histidine kinase inhibitor